MTEFYLDENVSSKRFIRLLREAGLEVTTCRELGWGGKPDAWWIPEASNQGFVIVTADARIRLIPAEKHAIIESRARIIVVRISATITPELAAHNFVNSRNSINRFIKKVPAPWMVRLTPPSLEAFQRGKSGRLARKEL